MSVPFAFVGIVFIWSTTPLAIKWSGDDVGFLFGVAARMAIALVLSIAIVALIRKTLPLDKKSLHVYLSVGIPMYAAMLLCYWGAQHVSSGLVSVVFGLTPIFTGLAANIWLAEKSFSVFKVLGMLFGMLGLSVIFQESLDFQSAATIGLFALLAATIFHSFGTVWFKKVGSEMPAFVANTGGLVVSTILLVITGIIMGVEVPTRAPNYVISAILYAAIFGSVVGAVLFYYSLKKVNATTIGLLPLITPVAALFIGQLFNGEIISTNTINGTATILMGLAVYQWADSFYLKFKSVRVSTD